jgi:hypothetical protein
VFITVDAGRIWRADQAGLLAPVQSEVLPNVFPRRCVIPMATGSAFRPAPA